jgi:ABC-type uncharacterized transport system fused permease/ATPase subunit
VLEGLETGMYERTLVHDSKVDIKSRGSVTESNEGIKFEGADIISPNGNELLKNINFEIKLG